MEYRKITNLLDNISNQPSKFRIKNWVEINNESRGEYNANSQVRFKGTIAVNNTSTADVNANNTIKKVVFKNCTP